MCGGGIDNAEKVREARLKLYEHVKRDEESWSRYEMKRSCRERESERERERTVRIRT